MNHMSPGAPPPIDAAASFRGDPGAFLRILVRGALLQLPTFGFYRFWLITDMRRHLWAQTRLGEDGFAYTGTAKELLIGFLVATAVLVPVYALYAIAGLVAETWAAFTSVPLFLVFWVFGHFALYRARAYKASRTQYRGLRFWMDGSGLAYAARAMAWDLAVVLTLGLAYPWRAASLERHKMRHTRFGMLQGGFSGAGAVLFRRGMLYWLAGLAIVGLVLVSTLAGRGDLPAALMAAAGVAIPCGLVLYPLLTAVRLRWQIEGTQFGPLGFQSRLRPGTVFWIYLKAALIVFGFFLAGGIVAGLLMAVFGSAFSGPVTSGAVALFGVVALLYLALILGFGVIKRFYIDRAVWSEIANTTTASGVAVLDTVAAAGDRAGSLGEGFADALDVSGGL